MVYALNRLQESFTVEHPCWFCFAKRSEIQEKEVQSGAFELRAKQEHDRQVAEVLHDASLVKQYEVKERPNMETRTILRVIVCDNDIRQIVLPVKPQTVYSLLEQLEEKLGLQYKFTLQFEDPDFNNSLVNLTEIADLPDKPTLKIVSLVTTPTPSTVDTEVLSVASDEHSRHSLRTAWPEAFEIPTFPVDVEYRLRQGNLQYMRDPTYLQLSGELKHEILEKLSETIYSYKAYPDKENSEAVAAALIIKHPCLTQPGSSNGWNGWYDSLRWKMGNYSSKLRRAGCLEVSINGGKRRGQQPQRNIKRPKRFEVNFLPNFPDGEDEASMESKRKEMVEDMKKRRLNAALIAQNMNSTFALRGKLQLGWLQHGWSCRRREGRSQIGCPRGKKKKTQKKREERRD
ncbi:uncharacterized protein LOC107693812 [Sinocyclocheilus anshuiensis]|uniref:uncharacterized protein LOC107693812 n=1 Tax=Sinocyclocheilus anshuiensis TaxID=1608454 RepID=UPI0007B88977|nr:PREDICTED: uncharacterized protein LOC107693812 [Sinocyclocheilus anshuiensis]